MPVFPVIRFSLKNAKLVRKGLENLRKQIPLVSKSRLRAVLIAIRNIMRKPGKKRPKWTGKPYIQWQTARQRMAFFASNGFGAGIPYRRKGVHEKAWKIISVREGYELGNSLETARFIYGTAKSRKQQKMHKGYWPIFLDVVDKEVKNLAKTVKDHLVQVAKQQGFEVKE